ncbi:MAG TPA: Crp/Fnr family transcriptional regulator [Clostridiales bacterium]|jgi:CRP/FNR family transcriptional regulator|nr:Crp/Fnr family transcriptional regulator [Clostridiales bacterium]
MNDTRAEYLCGRLDFWDSLSERQQSRLLDGTTISRYKKGSVIHNGVGDLGLIFVRRGRVCVYTVSEEGREFVLLRLFAGDCCALASLPMENTGFPVLINAETEADLMIIDSQAIKDICKTSIKAESFLRQLTMRHFCDVVSNMQNMLQVSAERRIVAYICRESDRMGTARIRTTHEQIARHVGTAREVVSRTLGRLASSGALELERGVIIIRDKSKLRKLM